MSNTFGSARGARQRKFWLDFARALAIISVTFNHALSRSFHTHSGTQFEFMQMSALGSVVKALLYVFSRLGVPIFLMISGALLMKRDYEDREVTQRFIKHNWWGLFRTTEIWLVIMFWLLQIPGRSVLHTQGVARALVKCVSTMLFLNQETMGSMWYMSMVLCVYLMIPVVAIGLKRLGDRFFYGLFGIVLLAGFVVPNINTALEAAGSGKTLEFAISSADIFSTYFLYVLAGYWISQGKMAKVSLPWLWVGLVVGFAGTAAFQYWIYSTPSDYYVRYADTGILMTGAFLFEIIRRRAGRFRTGAKAKAITYLSQISFGIYFVHICIMTVVHAALSSNLVFYPRFLILELTSLIGAIIIIWLTSKSKWVGSYLYLIKK